MASTVVGLFERLTDAEAARRDLVESGFSHGDIDLKAPGDAGAASDDLIRELESEGVPPDDARLYLAGVRAGDTLEVARTPDDRATLARDIMNRRGALDIHGVRARHGAAPVAAPLATAPLATAPLATDRADVRGEALPPDTVEVIVPNDLPGRPPR